MDSEKSSSDSKDALTDLSVDGSMIADNGAVKIGQGSFTGRDSATTTNTTATTNNSSNSPSNSPYLSPAATSSINLNMNIHDANRDPPLAQNAQYAQYDHNDLPIEQSPPFFGHTAQPNHRDRNNDPLWIERVLLGDPYNPNSPGLIETVNSLSRSFITFYNSDLEWKRLHEGLNREIISFRTALFWFSIGILSLLSGFWLILRFS